MNIAKKYLINFPFIFLILGFNNVQYAEESTQLDIYGKIVKTTEPSVVFVPMLSESSPKHITHINEVQSTPQTPIIRNALLQSFLPILLKFKEGGSPQGTSTENVILSTSEKIEKTLKELMLNVNNQLSQTPQYISFAFVPWSESFMDKMYPNKEISLSGYKLGSDHFGRPRQFRERVLENIRYLQEKSQASNTPDVYFLGMFANIKIQKNNSHVQVQFALGLKPRKIDFFMENKLIKFKEMVIPQVDDINDSTVILVSFNQPIYPYQPPTSSIELGPLSDIVISNNATVFKLKNDKEGQFLRCGNRHKSAPYLAGTLQSSVASGLTGKIANGKEVNFSIYKIDLDLVKIETKKIDLYLALGLAFNQSRFMFGCFKMDAVDEQFTTEVNKVVNEHKTQLENDLINYEKQFKEKLVSKLLDSI